MSKKPSKRKGSSRSGQAAPVVEAAGSLPLQSRAPEASQQVAGTAASSYGLELLPYASGVVVVPAVSEPSSEGGAPDPAPVVGASIEEPVGTAPVASTPDTAAPPLVAIGADSTLAMRLRAAREARGWSAEQLARATHLPSAIVADIEAGRFDRLGPAVYVRGYLRSYARAVGMPDVVVEAAPVAAPVEPELMRAAPMGTPTQRFATRFANPVIYGVMTIAVLVPLIYLARVHQDVAPTPALTALDGSVAELTMPLAGAGRSTSAVLAADDAIGASAAEPSQVLAGPAGAAPAPVADAVVPEQVVASAASAQAGVADAVAPAAPQSDAARAPAQTIADLPQPMLASIAPMSSGARGGRRVVLKLDEASWVEITGQDGRRIERALLPAGSVREYQVAGRADLQIGNTRGARLEVDGSAIDLSPHTRANVARIVVGADGVR